MNPVEGAATAPGQFFGRYRIDALLGVGGMGKVYRAWDPLLQCTVAVKLIHGNGLASGSSLATILQEARIASALNHPNICAIKDVVEADGEAGIVMEYVEGQPLSKLIPEKGMSSETVLKYGAEIADAVAHAHDHGIIHRDLKSANIVVTRDGRIKLLDFGLSQFVGDARFEEALPGVKSSTQASSAAGTLDYAAPEVLLGAKPDHRSDIWSLGVVAYEATTGKLPFVGETAWEVASAILRDAPPPLPPKVTPGLQAIILHCLAKDPKQRYQKCGEVRAALEALRSTRERKRPRFSLQIRITVGAIAVLIAAAGAGLFSTFGHSPAASVAVLTLAGDPATEYMRQGLTESITDNLSQTPKLKVYHYNGKEQDPKKVGAELGVKTVLMGKLAQQGDQLSINVELVDVDDGHQIWGTHYEQEKSQVVILQEQISREIAGNLSLHMSSGERQELLNRFADRYPENSTAYQEYLQGRYYWSRRSAGGLQLAVQHFQQAIQQDPNFALAYTGLADSYAFSTLIGGPEAVPPVQAMPQAKAAAARALQLNPSLAEAHTSMGHALQNFDWDWRGAEREFREAIKLNLNYANAHHWYAFLLMQTGRRDEAIKEALQAEQLAPFEPPIIAGVCRQYYLARLFDLAVQECRKTIDIDPSYVPGRIELGMAYEAKGMYREALAEYMHARQSIQILASLLGNPSAGTSPSVEALIGHAYAMSGDTARAQEQLNNLVSMARQRYVAPSYMAIICAALGRKDDAFNWLNQSYAMRSEHLLYLKVEPAVDPLRSDPRFATLVHRVGLPD
jgi:eukaryotic-like serine/threonine-protein kinase